jgi:hypothetical protein
MRILLCAGITCGSTHKSVNLQVELVSDVEETSTRVTALRNSWASLLVEDLELEAVGKT